MCNFRALTFLLLLTSGCDGICEDPFGAGGSKDDTGDIGEDPLLHTSEDLSAAFDEGPTAYAAWSVAVGELGVWVGAAGSGRAYAVPLSAGPLSSVELDSVSAVEDGAAGSYMGIRLRALPGSGSVAAGDPAGASGGGRVSIFREAELPLSGGEGGGPEVTAREDAWLSLQGEAGDALQEAWELDLDLDGEAELYAVPAGGGPLLRWPPGAEGELGRDAASPGGEVCPTIVEGAERCGGLLLLAGDGPRYAVAGEEDEGRADGAVEITLAPFDDGDSVGLRAEGVAGRGGCVSAAGDLFLDASGRDGMLIVDFEGGASEPYRLDGTGREGGMFGSDPVCFEADGVPMMAAADPAEGAGVVYIFDLSEGPPRDLSEGRKLQPTDGRLTAGCGWSLSAGPADAADPEGPALLAAGCVDPLTGYGTGFASWTVSWE